MKTYGVSRSTAAPPATVWRLWSDPNNWSRWNSGIHDVTFHDVHGGRGLSLYMAGSKIAQGVSMAGPLAFLFEPMMRNKMAKHFAPVLDDLARAAESSEQGMA